MHIAPARQYKILFCVCVCTLSGIQVPVFLWFPLHLRDMKCTLCLTMKRMFNIECTFIHIVINYPQFHLLTAQKKQLNCDPHLVWTSLSKKIQRTLLFVVDCTVRWLSRCFECNGVVEDMRYVTIDSVIIERRTCNYNDRRKNGSRKHWTGEE